MGGAPNTSDMRMMRATPYLLAAKNAGMPSTIGDDPTISRRKTG
jgi:hypothetical protein